MAVTGSICLGCCVLAPGTVAEGLARKPEGSPTVVTIEHPSGQIEVTADYSVTEGRFELKTAGLLRTARLLMRGEMMVPSAAFK
jgi:2-methylaconitate cis-trans-isomerase PrpF